MCELMLLAALKHMGLDPEVEPTTDASVPDARARWFDGDWIYFEASRVDIAVAKRDLWAFMVSVANDLFSCFTQPYHVEIAMDEATPTSQAAVVAEVRSMLINNSKESHVPGVAHIFISDIDVHRLRDYLKTVGDNTPRMTSNTGRIVPSPSGPIRRQVTISLPASDERAAEILERERRQLSRGCRNVIVLDVARVGTVSRWKELIERRLQPTLNTRIGSVLLTFRFAGTEGVGTKVTTIENAYARRPIPGGFLRSFEKALVEWRRRFQ